MLKSRAVYKATEAHLSSIIEDVSTLLDRKTKQKMLDIASTFDLPAAVCDELTKVFDSPVLQSTYKTSFCERKWDW